MAEGSKDMAERFSVEIGLDTSAVESRLERISDLTAAGRRALDDLFALADLYAKGCPCLECAEAIERFKKHMKGDDDVG